MKHKTYIILIGILVLHLFLLIYLKFTAWPEMILWPYLTLHKILPYRDIAIAHTPLMIAVLTLFYKIFGAGIIQLKIFTWALILGIDLSIYWIVKRLWNTKIALITLGAFAFWQLFFDGNGLWFDLFMGLFTLFSFHFVKNKKYFWTGIFWALAFISKQTAVWFLIPIGLEIVQSTRYLIQSIKKFVVGVLGILAASLLLLFTFHLLPSFWNWAIKFGVFILPRAEGQIQLPDLKILAISIFPFLVFIPLIWKTDKRNINLLIWGAAGAFGAYPRFEYFHFQASLPFLAIATGIVINDLKNKNKFIKYFLVFYIAGSIILFGGFFMRNFREGVRFYEQDVQDLVLYVKSNTKPNDKIFVMNWWDNIYALTDTLPATDPWVPQLSWYQKISGIQEKEVTDLKNTKPKLILLQSYEDSGLASYEPEQVYNYVMANYRLKEKVDGIEILIPKN